MSDFVITDIDGVGPARADTIAESGFTDVDEVAYAPLSEFVDATGINESTADGIISAATDLLEEEEFVELDNLEEDEDDATPEEVEVEVEEDEPESDVPKWISMKPSEYIGVTESNSDDTVIVPIQMNTQLLMHVIHITLEEATKKHQSSSFKERDDAYGLSRKLMALVADVGEEVDETVLLNKDELRSLYRAVSQGSANYASRSGIPKMWGSLETFKNVVNDLR